jgi:hypothetical protein
LTRIIQPVKVSFAEVYLNRRRGPGVTVINRKELSMNMEQLEARLKTLEDKVSNLEDIEEIKKLQRAYSYYLEHGMFDEMISLFSEDTESIETGSTGVYLGKEGVKKHFSPQNVTKDWLHVTMPLSGIVSVDTGGKTAKGRWYGWICQALPVANVTRALLQLGIYENEYVKENGKWKFKKLQFYRIFQSPYEDGWVKTPDILLDLERDLPPPDLPPTFHKPYPSGYIFPFHYKHPITGK